MSDVLYWQGLTLFEREIPSDHIGRGEYVRMVMNNRFQFAFLSATFPVVRAADEAPPPIWVESNGERFYAGSSEFCKRVGSMIRSRGLMANLSIRENLLLPFLYGGDEALLAEKGREVEEVADFIGLASRLNEQAGERSTYTHALVSLGHCLLMRPDVIVAQEVHAGMAPERLRMFRDVATRALKRLGSGILYLTSSEHEGSGIPFVRSHFVEDSEVPDVSGVW